MKKLFLFFIAVAMIAAFSVPAAAGDAEWNFYGSARMTTFWTDNSLELDTVHTPAESDADMGWAMQGNARIGARVSAGDVGGRFEYGAGTFATPTGGTSKAANIRLLYGTWNFGAGQLLVGQGYTPVNIFISNQVYGSDSDMLNLGGVYDGRRGMLRLKFGDFVFALVEPNTTAPALGPGQETDTTLPKVEVAYTFSTDMFKVGVVAGYNSVDIDTDTDDCSVDSWVAGLWGSVNLGPAYIKADVYQAQNSDNFGLWTQGDGAAEAAAGSVLDSSTLGYLFVAGVKLGDAFNIEGGYGQVSHESDVAGEVDDDSVGYYIQATIGLAPGVFIVPEIGKIDYDTDHANVDQGDVTYFGAKWQINF